MQDEATGAAGDSFGRETAPLIARAIGATMSRRGSNEAAYKAGRIVIKCAGKDTNSVGVTYRMLEGLDGIVGAFECRDGSFDVPYLPAKVFKEEMTPTRSKGASAGKVGIVRRQVFARRGERITIVRA